MPLGHCWPEPPEEGGETEGERVCVKKGHSRLTCVREKSHFLRRMQLSLAEEAEYSFTYTW